MKTVSKLIFSTAVFVAASSFALADKITMSNVRPAYPGFSYGEKKRSDGEILTKQLLQANVRQDLAFPTSGGQVGLERQVELAKVCSLCSGHVIESMLVVDKGTNKSYLLYANPDSFSKVTKTSSGKLFSTDIGGTQAQFFTLKDDFSVVDESGKVVANLKEKGGQVILNQKDKAGDFCDGSNHLYTCSVFCQGISRAGDCQKKVDKKKAFETVKKISDEAFKFTKNVAPSVVATFKDLAPTIIESTGKAIGGAIGTAVGNPLAGASGVASVAGDAAGATGLFSQITKMAVPLATKAIGGISGSSTPAVTAK